MNSEQRYTWGAQAVSETVEAKAKGNPRALLKTMGVTEKAAACRGAVS